MNDPTTAAADAAPVHLPTPSGTWGTVSAGVLWAAGIVSEATREDSTS